MRLAVACAVLLAGCAHAPSGPGAATVTEADTLEAAFARVRTGGSTVVRAEGHVVERVGDDVVRVTRAGEPGGQALDDAALERRIRARLEDRRIRVQVEGGVVVLRGFVGTQYEAVRAIESALAVEGVQSVTAQLVFPVTQARSGE